MIKSIICNIPATSQSYQIEIGEGLLFQQHEFLRPLASQFAIIVNDAIADTYGAPLLRALSSNGLHMHLLTFPHGEQHKSRATKEMLENELFAKGLGRDTCIIALGGGVTTDLVGYIASTYCRGVPFISIPTSLLAMVDASIGGKTGVNVPWGKNMLGSIYQPKKVIIDISTLQTLSKIELANGVVEMIKHGLIAERAYFEYLENHSKNILELSTINHAIFESCRIKKEIVEKDEKEAGIRTLLNFGHTFGHALENITHYSIAHGEAVAIGLIAESYLSTLLGYLDMHSVKKIKNILLSYGIPLKLPKTFSIPILLEAMKMDKKSRNGFPRFVMINGIGSSCNFDSKYCTHADESLIIKTLQWIYDDLHSH
jgi:3-dehydroquinate synthase